MSDKHVKLLTEAVKLPRTKANNDQLCSKIEELIASVQYTTKEYTYTQGRQLKNMLCLWIADNLNTVGMTFEATKQFKQGMTRVKWVESVLKPLALQLEDL
jgi:hypothetical protein